MYMFQCTVSQHVDSVKYEHFRMFVINCGLRHMTVCGNIFCDSYRVISWWLASTLT